MPSFISIPIDGIVTSGKPVKTMTYELDFDRHRMTSQRIDGLDAVNQFIRKALMTPRFKCLIYSTAYGSQIKQLITTSPTRAYLEASIYNIILDAIIHDGRIISMPREKFTTEFNGESLYITASIYTIYGETNLKEVFSDV